MKTFRFDNAEVSCKRIACNPCACDEYAVTIKVDGKEYTKIVPCGPFTPDEQLCADTYRVWLHENNN